MRDCLRGQFVLDGAVAEVRSFFWDSPETRIFENSDYVITGVGVDYVETHLPSNRLLYRLLNSGESTATRDASKAGEP